MPCDGDPAGRKCSYGKPRCNTGHQLKDLVKKKRIEFDSGNGSYNNWLDAYSRWQNHFMSKRRANKKHGNMMRKENRSLQKNLV